MKTFDYRELKYKKWDGEILSLVAQIHECKGRQELFLDKKPNVLGKLVEIAKIQSVEDSNKIEGIFTTSTRLKELIKENTVPRTRDEEEILGYRDVLNTIHESYEYIPIRNSYILQLHRDLYKYSPKSIGGSFKNTQNIIAETLPDGKKVEIFKPLAPYETPAAVESICENLTRAFDEKEVDSLLLIPIFIHDFLCIHPFNDGNGRMSRLLTTLLLYKEGYLVGKYISLESLIEKNKENYYLSLRKSGVNWHESEKDVSYFIKYLLGIILAAYRDFEQRVDYVDDKKTALDEVKEAIDNTYAKFTKAEILEKTPKIAKSSVEKSLKKLLEEEYIERHGRGKATFYTRK